MVLGRQLFVARDERVGDHEREGRVRLREREGARLELRDELAVWTDREREVGAHDEVEFFLESLPLLEMGGLTCAGGASVD